MKSIDEVLKEMEEGNECRVREYPNEVHYAFQDEIPRLIQAVRVMKSGLSESCMCGSHPEGLKNWCDACVALDEVAKILGGGA